MSASPRDRRANSQPPVKLISRSRGASRRLNEQMCERSLGPCARISAHPQHPRERGGCPSACTLLGTLHEAASLALPCPEALRSAYCAPFCQGRFGSRAERSAPKRRPWRCSHAQLRLLAFLQFLSDFSVSCRRPGNARRCDVSCGWHRLSSAGARSAPIPATVAAN